MPGHGGRAAKSSRRARRHCARRRRDHLKACHAPCEGAPRAHGPRHARERARREREHRRGAQRRARGLPGRARAAKRGKLVPSVSSSSSTSSLSMSGEAMASPRIAAPRAGAHSRARAKRPKAVPCAARTSAHGPRPGRPCSWSFPRPPRWHDEAACVERGAQRRRSAHRSCTHASTRRQCQRLQLPRPKAAVMPGATLARAGGVPEHRKAPQRARERRRRGPQGTPQVRARAAWPGLG